MYAFVTEIPEDFNKKLEKSTYKIIWLLHLENIQYYIIYNSSPYEIFPFKILKILIDFNGKF